jgi:fatty acid desaturase
MLGGMGGTVRAKLTFLLVAWLAAFIVVMLLFLVFGWLLEELPLAGRALVISGVLTITMTQLAFASHQPDPPEPQPRPTYRLTPQLFARCAPRALPPARGSTYLRVSISTL